MKKPIVFSLLIHIGICGLFAQNPFASNLSEQDFNKGKELFDAGKYAAAGRYFETYLQSATPIQAGQRQEAEYYLAATAYELEAADAGQLLDRYAKKHPYSPFADRVSFMQGMVMFKQKNYTRSLAYFRKTDRAKLDRHDLGELQYCEAYALLQTGNYAKASDAFKKLLGQDTRYNTSASYYYAYCEYIQGNFDEALPVFLELENAQDYRDVVPYYIIQIYYSRGAFDQIGARAEKLLAESPDNSNNAEIYRITGEIAYAQQNYSKAIESLKKYESMSPQVLRNDMYLLGLSFYQTGDYASAILYLSKVTAKQDEMTENAYLHIGNSYIKQGDKANARMAYEAALGSNFNPAVREEALYNYALTTYESDAAFGESITAFERLLSEFPESKHADKAYNYLSAVYMTTQNFTAAYNSIQKIKKPNTQLIATRQYLLNRIGEECFMQKDYEKAAERFTEALAQTPNRRYAAESLYWRAETYYRMDQPERALADLQAFYANPQSKSSPNLKASYYLSGYVRFALKQYGEALGAFEKYISGGLLAKDPTYADAMNRIGDCHFFARNFAEAEKSYSTALVASPHTGDYPLFQVAYVNGLQKKYADKISALEKLTTDYPKSQYADDALYEIGRSHLMLEHAGKALQAYERLLSNYANSELAPKAALEKGMVYFNQNDLDNAIKSFKYVIARYPGSEESGTALKSLETAYIEQNNVAEYIAYTQSLGETLQTAAVSREDSLMFIAAEKQYMRRNFKEAAEGLTAYLAKYCTAEGNPVCTTARYYLADCYYTNGDKERALAEYEQLAKVAGNKYMEESVMRAAEITYDKKDYAASLVYFGQLEEVAHNSETKNMARLGILRCSYFLNDHQKTVDIAGEIIADAHTDADVKTEALYNRGKAYMALGKDAEALPDFQVVSENTRTPNGAEAKFHVAEIHFNAGRLDEAEATITDFARKNTPYQYWLARSFVVLADVYVARGDDFQAKQYLLSLQKNYTADNDVQTMIKERLEAINKREQENIIN